MVGTAPSQDKTDTVRRRCANAFDRRPTVDKKLEMRCKIEAVFEHYAEESEYFRRANVAQRVGG